MATSGSINYSVTRNDIIEAAYRHAGVVGLKSAVPSDLLSYAAKRLNSLVKHWETLGLNLWRVQTGTIALVSGTSEYKLGNDASYANASDTFYRTTISADEAAAQTILSVTSGSNMTASDVIGIELDDGTMQWSTVSSATATTVTIADALTGAAASGNQVYSFTTRMNRPLQIRAAQMRDSSLQDRPLIELSRHDYLRLPNKTLAGTPTSVYYDPRRETYGVLYVYPTPNDSTDTLYIDYVRTTEDFDAATDTPDFPQEWALALEYNLAVILCHASNKEKKAEMLKQEAREYLSNLLAWDAEQTPFSIVPENLHG